MFSSSFCLLSFEKSISNYWFHLLVVYPLIDDVFYRHSLLCINTFAVVVGLSSLKRSETYRIRKFINLPAPAVFSCIKSCRYCAPLVLRTDVELNLAVVTRRSWQFGCGTYFVGIVISAIAFVGYCCCYCRRWCKKRSCRWSCWRISFLANTLNK